MNLININNSINSQFPNVVYNKNPNCEYSSKQYHALLENWLLSLQSRRPFIYIDVYDYNLFISSLFFT